MENNLFSLKLKKFDNDITNVDILKSLSQLEKFLGVSELEIFEWDEKNIAIPIQIDIELPPHGNFKDIDIRKNENIVIVINLKFYPTSAPKVFTDRIDFPKDKLAHLYIAKDEKPPAFCLVKGDQNDWYSNKRMSDIIIRTKNWFRDAASGELTENANYFEPLRLEGYNGTIIYKYDELADLVENNSSHIDNSNFAMALFENTSNIDVPSFKFIQFVYKNNYDSSIKLYLENSKKYIEQLTKKTYDYNKFSFGYIIWSKEETIFDSYSVSYPNFWSEFKEYCMQFSISINQLESFISENDINFFTQIPIIVGIKRPSKIIGYSKNIEFINFYIKLNKKEQISNGEYSNEIPVKFQAHREPLSIIQAQRISGYNFYIDNPIIFGCGALGSKIAMHFIRNGVANLKLVDHDEFSPHNFVRHSLLAGSEGMNKASALAKVIRSAYRFDELPEIIEVPLEGSFFINEVLSKVDLKMYFFDFTTSENFATYLVKNQNLSQVKICKASIVNNGNIGVLFFEGKSRNPRIDDLQIILYSMYKEDDFISEWLKEEHYSKNNQSEVNVGIGCNSETTILTDEIITLHSAYFYSVIKKYTNPKYEEKKDGTIYLSQIINNSDFNIQTRKVKVEPFVVYQAENDNSWEIRVFKDVINKISNLSKLSTPNETGGIFIGIANYKTNTIHVVDLVSEPDGSYSNTVCFVRGVGNLPENVKEINKKSGNQLGYIGEWHSHPMGLDGLSPKDINTVKKLIPLNNKIPIPTFIAVFSNSKLFPYVFN